jgi:CRISPR-associated exonuclease Cas4
MILVGSEPEKYISAGDIEKYGYCPLSWWLSKGREETEESEVMDKGSKKHAEIGSEVRRIRDHEEKVKETDTGIMYFSIGATIVAIIGLTFLPMPLSDKLSQILAAISLIWLLAACYYLYRAETLVTEDEKLIAERIILGFAMTATVIAILAVTVYLSSNVTLSSVFVTMALIWLIGACFFLYKSLMHLENAMIFRLKHDIEGEVKYVDDDTAKPKLFISKKHHLRGRPDYVLLIDDDHIPVEVKTGRVPRGPLFSHILQLAAYCLLVEDEYTRPPYGILRYGGIEHEIEFEDELRTLLLNKMTEMRSAESSKNVHRNHNRPGKCKYCSRRDICPEKLE